MATYIDEERAFKKTRLCLWLLLTVPYILTYFHRVALNVVADQLMAEFSLTATALGNLAAIYSYMYLFLQVPGGALIDRWGPRRIAAIGAFLISAGSILFALSPNYYTLYTGRLLVGLGGSVLLVNVFKFQASWFKASEFGTMTGLAIFLGNLGPLVASRPLAGGVEVFGWRLPFMIVGLIAVMASLFCLFFIKNTPAEAGFTFNPERAATSPHPDTMDTAAIPGGYGGAVLALKNPHIWLTFLMGFGIYGTFITFTGAYGVPFLMQIYELSRESAATFMLLVALGNMTGSPSMGFISDRLQRRKLPVQVSFFVFCLIWGLLLFWPGGRLPLMFLYPLCFLFGFSAAGTVPIRAYSKEISHPAFTGSGTATSNMGNFMGVAVIQSLFGYLLDYRWEGLMIEGVKIYPLAAFRLGLGLCFSLALCALLLTVFIKETTGKNIYAQLVNPRKSTGFNQ